MLSIVILHLVVSINFTHEGKYYKALHWRHNERDGVPNHQPTIVYWTVHSGADQRKHQTPTEGISTSMWASTICVVSVHHLVEHQLAPRTLPGQIFLSIILGWIWWCFIPDVSNEWMMDHYMNCHEQRQVRWFANDFHADTDENQWQITSRQTENHYSLQDIIISLSHILHALVGPKS